MKVKQLRDMTKQELIQKARELKEELFKLNFQRKMGRVEKPHRFKLLKRDIARLNTILREKEIGEDIKS